jgi:hypothetical protein
LVMSFLKIKVFFKATKGVQTCESILQRKPLKKVKLI